MDDRAERAWRAAAEKAIGGPFERLRTQTTDGFRVACLCGTDAAYADEAQPLARALREAGASRVPLAGWSADGNVIALHHGCDAIAILSDTLDAALAP